MTTVMPSVVYVNTYIVVICRCCRATNLAWYATCSQIKDIKKGFCCIVFVVAVVRLNVVFTKQKINLNSVKKRMHCTGLFFMMFPFYFLLLLQ